MQEVRHLLGAALGRLFMLGPQRVGKGKTPWERLQLVVFSLRWLVFFFFFFFWSLEEVVRWGEPSLKEEAWEVSTGWDSSVSLVMVNPFPARNHR